jgi:predicted ATPase/DNA-binding SARP family transcriptional activator
MSAIHLQVLGPPVLSVDGQATPIGRKKLLGLLLYLLLQRRNYTRDHLAALLWPDKEQQKARGNLRRVLSEVASTVSAEVLETQGEMVGISPSLPSTVDSIDFERHLNAVDSHVPEHAGGVLCVDCTSRLADAVDLYQDEFLHGFTLADCIEYTDWQFQYGEHIKRRVLHALDLLVDRHLLDGDYETVAEYANRIIKIDPLSESAYMRLVETYAKSGRTSLAVHVFRRLEAALKRELGIEPSDECQRLYQIVVDSKIALAGDRTSEDQDSSAMPLKLRKLPHHVTQIVGREGELSSLCALVREHRLVTVAGLGGIGKTRLAIEVGSAVIDSFPHGVVFADLAGAAVTEDIHRSVAAALGLNAAGASSVDRMYDAFLESKHLLLILDNCEQVIDSVSEIAGRLLESSRHVHILATSRESLRIGGEHLFGVASLDRVSSEELFVERARAAGAILATDTAERETIRNICRRLDGIPLALEIAAARLRVVSLRELQHQLVSHLDQVENPARDAPERHTSLRSLFDWSFRLLSDVEQRLLAGLSLFQSGFTAQACQAVCLETNPIQVDGDPVWAWLIEPGRYERRQPGDRDIVIGSDSEERSVSLIQSTMEKSLINRGLSQGRSRYSMLEPIRQYAMSRLLERKGLAQIKERYVDYYVFMTEEFQIGMIGTEQTRWLAWVDAEHRNVTSALAMALDELQDYEKAGRIMSCLWAFWHVRGQAEDGYVLLERVLDHSSEISSSLVRGKLYLAGGQIAFAASRHQRAQELFTLALELGQACDMAGVCAWGGMFTSQTAFWDQPHMARSRIVPALEFFTLHEHYFGMFLSLRLLAALDMMKGDLDAAQRLCKRALRVTEESGDLWFRSQALARLAQFALYRGRYDQVAEIAEQYFDLDRVLGGDQSIATVYLHLGVARLCEGMYDEAVEYLAAAVANDTENRRPYWLAVSLFYLGWVAMIQHEFAKARGFLARGLEASLETDAFDDGALRPLLGYAWLLIASGELERAATYIGVVDGEMRKGWHFFTPYEQSHYEAQIAQLKGGLGEAVFRSAFEHGKGVDRAGAVRRALVECSRTDTPSDHNSL